MRTAEIFKNKTVFSLEVFPPKPESDESVIYKTLDALSDISPDFISVTYGAGGGANGSKTIQIASDLKHKYNITSVAHLPCINLTKEDAVSVLDELKEKGIENILALRGDIPEGTTPKGDFRYASDLVTFIKERYDFNIIGACYPEVHKECTSAVEDIRNLKHKVDCGVDHLITQLFLDNTYFHEFREKLELAGIDVPLEAGIMPVTNKKQIERMVKLSNVTLPKKFIRMLDKYDGNPEALRDAGIAYAVDQIADLMADRVDGIHLYTMNNPYIAHKIYDAVKSLISVGEDPFLLTK